MVTMKYIKQICWLLLTLALLASKVQPARAAPLSIDQYWQQVADTQSSLAALSDTPLVEARPQLDELAGQWATIDEVILADGTSVAVDHSWLISQLRAEQPNLPLIQARLDTLLAARATWPDPAWTSDEAAPALASLDQLTQRREFQWADTDTQQSPIQEWLDRQWQRLLDRLRGFLPEDNAQAQPQSDSTRAITINLTNLLFAALGVLVLAAILFFVLRGLLGNVVGEATLDPNDPAGDELLTSDSAIKRAQQLSKQQDYRTAVRYLYLASLLLLEERGLLRYDRSRTNFEYLRSVAHLPELSSILTRVINVFDRVWYGFQTIDQDTYDQYLASVRELRRQR